MAQEGWAGAVTNLAGTACRRTVGVAGEQTVGRAKVLVAVVMCLAAVSEASYGASNGGLGEVPTVAALFVLPLLYVFPATRPLWLRHRKSLCHADRRSQSASSAFANRRSAGLTLQSVVANK